MMAFANDFVATICVNNKPLREFQRERTRTCIVPFGSEYSLKLKNKRHTNCMVEVSIDGTDVLNGSRLILQPYQTMELERFIEGGKFKFISEKQALETNQLQDPDEPDKGIVEIKFYQEVVPQYTLTTSSGCENIVSVRGMCTQPSSSTYSYSVNNTLGVTVEGGRSDQQFVQSSGFCVSDTPTVIRIKLEGPSAQYKDTYYVYIDTFESPVMVLEAHSLDEAFVQAKKNYEGRHIMIKKRDS